MASKPDRPLPKCLEEARIVSLPAKAYYIPNFISVEDERSLLDKIAAAPKPKWKILKHRRLQAWPSDLTKDTLLESPLPVWLATPILPRLESIPLSSETNATIFSDSPHRRPNHVLINEYLPGQGIMPHKDGAAYHPVVCTVSLGATLCLDIYRSNADGTREDKPLQRILQEPRSLLVTTDDLYKDYMHGIADIMADIDLNVNTVANWSLLGNTLHFEQGINERRTRMSLTYRDVLKVSKLGHKITMFGKR